MKRLILVASLIALTTACAHAPADAPTRLPAKASVDTPVAATSAATPVISQQTHDDIMTLLQITLGPHLGDVTRVMSTMYVSTLQAKYRDISPAVADEIRADIGKIVTDPERVKSLEESMVPVYAKLYSDDEVRQILAFSKTPAGAKMFSGMPNQQQLNEALQPWAVGTVAPAIMMDTARILKEHNIVINPDGTSSQGPDN